MENSNLRGINRGIQFKEFQFHYPTKLFMIQKVFQKTLSFIPSKIRAVSIVLVLALIIFAISKSFGNGGGKDTKRTFLNQIQDTEMVHNGNSRAGHVRSLVGLAADSVNRASSAETVVDQLRHLTFGISQLEAAKITLDGNVKLLSSLTATDVPKLEAYLHHAETLCVSALKKNGSKETREIQRRKE